MNINANFEHRADSSQDKHEGESSLGLCDRLDRTRDNSQRQLPTDHDYAVPTREYQTDQSSLKTAPAAARSVLEKTQRQQQKHPHRFRSVDRVTPYQANALIAQAPCGLNNISAAQCSPLSDEKAEREEGTTRIVVFPSPCFGEDSSACSPALSQSHRHPGARPVPPP